MSTVSVSKAQYKQFIKALLEGIAVNDECRDYQSNGKTLVKATKWLVMPNKPLATMLQIEANTGIRIGDVIKLRRGDIVLDGNRYRFDITEQKTGKHRAFTVPDPVYDMIENFCIENGIEKGERIFSNINEESGVRGIQKILKKISKHFGYDNISTHSFRKYFATKAYISSGYDIELVSRLLQHSSPSITRRYIGIEDERTEQVIQAAVSLV